MLNFLSRIFSVIIITGMVLPGFSRAAENGFVIRINNLVESDIQQELPDDKVKLSQRDLINIALENNQSLEVVRQKLAQSRGRLTQAKSGYLPHLSVEGNYNYTHREDSFSSVNYGDSQNLTDEQAAVADESEEDDVVHGAVSLSQLLYDFGKTTGAIDVGKFNLKAADVHLKRQIQDVIFQVKKAYFDVLEKKRLVDVAEESVKILTKHRNQAAAYYHAGMRSRIDVINADVELSKADMNLVQAKYALKTARVALEQILGIHPYRGKYIVAGDNVNLDNILAGMPPVADNLDNLITQAIKQRPDILRLKHLTEAAMANLQQVKGDYWPTINAEARYENYDTDISLYKDNWEAGIALKWELFSGLHTRGAVAEARGGVLENKAQLRDLYLLVVREVTENYLNAEQNRESVHIALQTLNLAKENLTLADKRYQSGTYNVVEYNDAQFSLTKARSDLVVTYYSYLTSLAGIEHTTGSYQLDDTKQEM